MEIWTTLGIALALPIQYYATLMILYLFNPTRTVAFLATGHHLQILKTLTALSCLVILRVITPIPFPSFHLPSFRFLLTLFPYSGQISYVFYTKFFGLSPVSARSRFSELFYLTKNCLIAPFVEEYIYRHILFQSTLKFGGFNYFFGPLLFGVAHLHHIVDQLLFAPGILDRHLVILEARILSFL
jgi:hypothetical protein